MWLAVPADLAERTVFGSSVFKIDFKLKFQIDELRFSSNQALAFWEERWFGWQDGGMVLQ